MNQELGKICNSLISHHSNHNRPCFSFKSVSFINYDYSFNSGFVIVKY